MFVERVAEKRHQNGDKEVSIHLYFQCFKNTLKYIKETKIQ